MNTNTLAQDSQKFRTWINAILFSNPSTLTRILCLLDLCDGVNPIDSEFVEDALILVLEKDIDPIVRHEAAFALYKLYNKKQIRGEKALRALCNSANNDVSTVARHEAAESLGFFNHPVSLQTLNNLLNDTNPDVVATAKLSLERLSKD